MIYVNNVKYECLPTGEVRVTDKHGKQTLCATTYEACVLINDLTGVDHTEAFDIHFKNNKGDTQ